MLKKILSAALLLSAAAAFPQNVLPSVIAAPAAILPYQPFVMHIGEVCASESVPLVARVEGTVTKINFQEGQKVKQGDLLFEIDPREYKAKVQKAESTLIQAKAKADNRATEYKRQNDLLAKGSGSQKDVDLLRAERDSSEAEVQASQAELDLAKLNLEYTKIRAPFDGWVGFRNCSLGELVGPGAEKQELATIEKSGQIKVNFNMAETDLITLFRNMESEKVKVSEVPVELYFQDGTKVNLKGFLKAWDNKINQNTGTLKIQAVFDDPDRDLLPGLYVKVKLPLGPKQDRIAIPLSAVTYDVAGSYIFVLQDAKDGKAKAERRYIQIAARDGATAFLKNGLKKNELLVVSGMQKLRSGSECAYTLQSADPAKQKQLDGAEK